MRDFVLQQLFLRAKLASVEKDGEEKTVLVSQDLQEFRLCEQRRFAVDERISLC